MVWRLPGRILPSLAVVLYLAGVAGAGTGTQEKRPLQWRVPGAAEALVETAWVRLQVSNGLGPGEASEHFGLVQTVAFVFASRGEEEHPLVALSDREDLAVVGLNPDLVAPGEDDAPLLITLEPAGIDPEAYAVGLVLGGPVRLVSTRSLRKIAASQGRIPSGMVRVDRADLEDRRRWAAETLVLPGQTRILWEGPVRLSADRLYADYLVARPARLDLTTPQPGPVPDGLREPAGGILDMPLRVQPLGAPTSVTFGPTVARPFGPRIFPISLQRDLLNIVELRAGVDAAGSYQVAVEVTVVPLEAEGAMPLRRNPPAPARGRPSGRH